MRAEAGLIQDTKILGRSAAPVNALANEPPNMLALACISRRNSTLTELRY